MTKKRSVGIMIIGVVLFISAVYFTKIIFTMLYLSKDADRNIILFLFILVAFFSYLGSFAIIKRKEWGRQFILTAAMGCSGLQIIRFITSFSKFTFESISLSQVVFFFFCIFIIYYFNHPKVKEQFKQKNI